MNITYIHGLVSGELRIELNSLAKEYLDSFGLHTLNPMSTILGAEIYLVHNNNKLIGFVSGIKVSNEIWFADKVYLRNRREFKSVIDYFKRLKLQQGYKYITTSPSSALERLYVKHNLMKPTRI